MSSYAFHPEAVADLDEIWEYIAEDNIDAADGYSPISTRLSPRSRHHQTSDIDVLT